MALVSNTFSISVVNQSIADWVPASGFVQSVPGQVNLLSSLAPVQTAEEASGSFEGIIDAWCQTAYARTMGTYGSLIAYGGGHSNSSVNGVYRYDLETKTWSVFKTPAGVTTPSCNGKAIFNNPSTNYMADNVLGEYFTDTSGTTTWPGEVASCHTYGKLIWTPQGSFGSDASGYLWLGGTQALPKGGAQHGRTSWHMPLSGASGSGAWTQGVTWSATPGYGPAAYDSTRNRILLIRSPSVASSTQVAFVQTPGSSTETNVTFRNSANTANQSIEAGYSTLFYSESLDRFIRCPGQDFDAIYLIHPTTWACTSITPVGFTHLTSAAAWEWVESSQMLVATVTNGGNKVNPVIHKVTAPASPLSNPWTYTTQTLSGTLIGEPATSHPQLNRLKYVPLLDCFVYVPMTNLATQVFRL